jgi:Fic family protein
MNSGDYKYIWQSNDWPNWYFDLAALAGPMADVSRAQGLLMGRLADVGMALRDQASLAALTEDVVKTSEIEGEQLNVESVRSSIARRLGVDIGALAPVDRHVEGVVEMVLDATANCHAPVSRERLFGWHAALFPTGYSGLSKIKFGAWRDDASGPMQVVSGPSAASVCISRRRPPIAWRPKLADSWTGSIAHRTSRRCSRPALAICGSSPCTRSTTATAVSPAPSATCCWRAPTAARSASTVCRRRSSSERKAYYDILERTQKRSMDVTEWLAWFLDTSPSRSRPGTAHTRRRAVKARFWQRWATMPLNERQVKLLNKLLDGFEGKLTSSKWAAIAKCSPDTALRDINDLLSRGVLRKTDAGGRSTSYELNDLLE